ncbi:MAG: thioredoxin family protein [Candidatus Edwardsbacteria bacterium]|nr:thioredoxin family protein [Candidatus Edwardsbacteria bacterium]
MKRSLLLATLAASLALVISCTGKKAAENKTAGAGEGGAQTEWIGFDQAMARAAQEDRIVIVDFSTEWCKWCKVMLAKTYTDPQVVKAIEEKFLAVPIDGESPEKITYLGKTVTQSDFTLSMKVEGFPTTMFLDKEGKVLEQRAGYIDATNFLKMLNFFSSGAYKTTKLDDYLTGK